MLQPSVAVRCVVSFGDGLHRILFDDLEQPVAGGIGGRTAVISTEPRLYKSNSIIKAIVL